MEVAVLPPLSPAFWNLGPGHRGPQAREKLPSAGAGPQAGRWSGTGQNHLIKHRVCCFVFSGRRQI